MGKRIRCGQKVKDKVTGFTGIAVSRTEFLHGCFRVEVQPPAIDANKIPETGAFDEPQLEVIDNGIYVPPKKPLGGPHRGHNPGKPIICGHREDRPHGSSILRR